MQPKQFIKIDEGFICVDKIVSVFPSKHRSGTIEISMLGGIPHYLYGEDAENFVKILEKLSISQ